MNLDKWKSQIVRGTLEYCILLMLDKKVYYGYEILQELSKYPIITSTESTVYPLLRRLQKENYLHKRQLVLGLTAFFVPKFQIGVMK